MPIKSFYLELRVTKYAEGEPSIVYDIDLLRIMRLLNKIDLASIRDPMGVSGSIEACSSYAKRETALSKLAADLKRAETAYLQRDSSVDDCFYWWNVFYNNKFPSR